MTRFQPLFPVVEQIMVASDTRFAPKILRNPLCSLPSFFFPPSSFFFSLFCWWLCTYEFPPVPTFVIHFVLRCVRQPPCTPQSLRDCLNALEGADPNTYCCNEVRALNTECLCALYAEYGGGQSQNQGTVQSVKQIATYCDPQRRGGFNCAWMINFKGLGSAAARHEPLAEEMLP